MIKYKYKDLFLKRHTDKQMKISTDDGKFTATNSEIHWEDFELTESLCSESQVQFGCCESSVIKFQILNAYIPLAGKWLTVSETLAGAEDEPFVYGRYKVYSDVPTADREYRDIVAYDAMYDIINSDAIKWYNTILPNPDSKVTMKQFRTSFIESFGLEQQEATLVNDDMIVEKTIQVGEASAEEGVSEIIESALSGKDVITAICEINGCFGHIGRDGKFHWIYLEQNIQGLYPADFLYPDHVPEQWNYLAQATTGHLYPQDPKGEGIGSGRYISCKYEDYIVRTITKLQIRQEENDIGCIYGDGDNAYIIQNNFLVYGKSAEELEKIAGNIFQKISGVVYRPFSLECVGNPCFEVGDSLRVSTKYELVESYIFRRTLKGIQGKRDSYSATGQELRAEKTNSLQYSIIQLKGKANILTRTVDETKLEMYDIEEGLYNTINITAGQFQLDLQNTKTELSNTITITAAGLDARITDTKNELSNSISVTAKGLEAQITDTSNNLQTQITATANGLSAEITRASTAEGNLSNSIKITADGLNAEISRASAEEGNLSNRISVTASGLSSEISRATAAEGNLSSRISQNAAEIELKVDYNGIISAINLSKENATIKAEKINLNGYTSINGNFNVDNSGNLTIGIVSDGSFNTNYGKIYLGLTGDNSSGTLRLRNSAGKIIAITADQISFSSSSGSLSQWTKMLEADATYGFQGRFDYLRAETFHVSRLYAPDWSVGQIIGVESGILFEKSAYFDGTTWLTGSSYFNGDVIFNESVLFNEDISILGTRVKSTLDELKATMITSNEINTYLSNNGYLPASNITAANNSSISWLKTQVEALWTAVKALQ